MSAQFTVDDLRRLADSLEGMAAVALNTEVTVSAYTGSYVEINEHQIRITWDADRTAYTAEWPDST